MTATDEADGVYFVNEVAIGVGNCAVDEEGNILLPSAMTLEQLRAELSAKELPSDGKRTELLKRVQVRSVECVGCVLGAVDVVVVCVDAVIHGVVWLSHDCMFQFAYCISYTHLMYPATHPATILPTMYPPFLPPTHAPSSPHPPNNPPSPKHTAIT